MLDHKGGEDTEFIETSTERRRQEMDWDFPNWNTILLFGIDGLKKLGELMDSWDRVEGF